MNWPEQVYIAQRASKANDNDYDEIFGLGKNRKNKRPKKTEEETAAAKEKRRAFFGKLGQGFQDAGGAEGILGTVTNVVSLFKGSDDQMSSDFELSMGQKAESDKKSLTTGILIIGGISVLIIGGLIYTKRKMKNTQFSSNQS